MGKQDDIAARLGMLDLGVAQLAMDGMDAPPEEVVALSIQHLQATAAVEQACALHRIADALEALGRGEQISA